MDQAQQTQKKEPINGTVGNADVVDRAFVTFEDVCTIF
jgi:hypothetical protein